MPHTLMLNNSGAVVPTTGSPDYGSGATDFAGVCVAIGSIDAKLGQLLADTGTANAYAVATPWSATLTAGLELTIKMAHANTGASTLALNGGAAKAITKAGTTALAGAEISANQIVIVIYDGTEWQLISQ
jgi:hypothetical protein